MEQAPGVWPLPAVERGCPLPAPSPVGECGSLGHPGISTCGPQAQYSCRVGLAAPRHMGPSWTRVGPLPMPWQTDSCGLHRQQSPCMLFLCNIFVEFVTIWLLLFTFWFFGCRTFGILDPQPGIKAAPAALESEVLTTGQPGNSHQCALIMKNGLSGDGWMASPTQETRV